MKSPHRIEWEEGSRVALEFSGGRDSLACLYLLHDQGLLSQVTVYWCDSGDNFPETHELIAELRTWVPDFVITQGDSPGIRQRYGWPSDLVPCNTEGMGPVVENTPVMLQNRYDCCARAIMKPLHDQVTADDCNVIIRGQRLSDDQQNPIRHGETHDGITYLYPIDHWEDRDVMDFLELIDAPVPPYYQHGLTSAPDCKGCTAWLDEHRGPYLKRFHPQAFKQYQQRLAVIATESAPHIENLMEELQ